MTLIIRHYDNPHTANEALEALLEAGFQEKQIGFLTKQGVQGHFHAPPEIDTGNMDGVEGATLGTLAGMVTAVAAMATPFGLLVAAGPLFGVIVGALAGAATGGAVASLLDFGIDERTAQRLAATLEDEKAMLLSVEVPEARAEEAREILAQTEEIHQDELRFFEAYHEEHAEIAFEEFASAYHYGYRAAARHRQPFEEVDWTLRMEYPGDYELDRDAIEIGYNRYRDTLLVIEAEPGEG